MFDIDELIDTLARNNPLDLVFGTYTMYYPTHVLNLSFVTMLVLGAAGLQLLSKRDMVGWPMLAGAIGAFAATVGLLVGTESSVVWFAAFVACALCGVLSIGVAGWMAWRPSKPSLKWLQVASSVLSAIVFAILGNGLSSYRVNLFAFAYRTDPYLWVYLLIAMGTVAILAAWHLVTTKRHTINYALQKATFRKGNNSQPQDQPDATSSTFQPKGNHLEQLEMSLPTDQQDPTSRQHLGRSDLTGQESASQGHIALTFPPVDQQRQ